MLNLKVKKQMYVLFKDKEIESDVVKLESVVDQIDKMVIEMHQYFLIFFLIILVLIKFQLLLL